VPIEANGGSDTVQRTHVVDPSWTVDLHAHIGPTQIAVADQIVQQVSWSYSRLTVPVVRGSVPTSVLADPALFWAFPTRVWKP